ncbi:EKI1-like protein [Mya arenaria]|uniref:ethanolamine kinase n=1 Tax=Mya arenaria TaxID=6604 RepID=A0ABY7FR05_MYAAR|nr:EKI1-like protein [Mya arenaria]
MAKVKHFNLRRIHCHLLRVHTFAKVFSNGISNQLYGYYLYDQLGETVLIRINGVGTELFTDRVLEKEIIKTLHARGLCAPLYATFNNGIAYGYVSGETLDADSVRQAHIGR